MSTRAKKNLLRSENAYVEEQRKTQQLLAISQRLAHIGSWETELSTGTLSWSDEMYRILGFPSGQQVSLAMAESVFPPGELIRFRDAIAAAIRGDAPYSMDYSIIRNDGVEAVIHDEGEVIYDELGTAVRMFGTTQDITERKKADEALKKSEEKFSKAFKTSPEAITIASMDDGTYIDVNDIFIKLTGFTREQVIGRTSTDLNVWVEPNERRQYIRELLTTGTTKNFETRFRMNTGEIRNFLVSSEIIDLEGKQCSLNFILDITERKRANAKLQQLSQAVEQSPVSIVITDTMGSIEYVNQKFVEVTGYSVEEAIGKNPRILKSGHTSPAEYELVWKALTRGEEWRGEFHNKKKNGELYWESATISPIINAYGETTHYLAIKEDITERKQGEEHVRKMEERLRQSEKMEAVGQLAGGIAHDFNNVLGGIIGFTDLSLNYVEKGSMLESNLFKVLKAADRAKHLVKQILAFSRQGNPQKSIVDIHPIVNEVLELLRSSIPSSVIIESHLELDTKPVLADPTQIHQALLNLATNAVHAMSRKGTLTVRLFGRILHRGEYGHAGEIPAGEYTILEVADTGSGMDDLTMSKAFKPFFTTKAVGEGTGMGLSVVLGVVQSHGGDIQVESEQGNGTIIRIYLPAAESSVSDYTTVTARVQRIGSERILFVDDEPMLVDMAENILVPLGYTVTGMADCLAALRFVREKYDEIDLLVTDQTMPGLTGTELAAEALKLRKNLPVILCTGFSNEIDADLVSSLGIRMLVMKPYGTHELSNIIRDVLDGKKK